MERLYAYLYRNFHQIWWQNAFAFAYQRYSTAKACMYLHDNKSALVNLYLPPTMFMNQDLTTFLFSNERMHRSKNLMPDIKHSIFKTTEPVTDGSGEDFSLI